MQDIIDRVRSYAPDADVRVLTSAYALAVQAHKGQVRKTGGDYIEHPLAVAAMLADIRMDLETIATGLLHDALEDHPMPAQDMVAAVGPVITNLVTGVTKIGKLQFRSKEVASAENFRKLMLAMSRDPRVLLVKLADRLHNMSTLDGHRRDKQVEIARETMDVFVPFANRLGLGQWRAELEDHCIAVLEPEATAEVRTWLDATQPDRAAYIERATAALRETMASDGIPCEVIGRAKHVAGIVRKMAAKGQTIERLPDLLAFRVVVADRDACYLALARVHGAYSAVEGRLKDYIGHPKPNGYQSIHTTIVGPEGRRVEVQIRSQEMDRLAEAGIAAHWRYKEGRLAVSVEEIGRVSRLRELIEAAQGASDAGEFRELVRAELGGGDDVIVETPKGDLRRLPIGATVLDFAYAIHTELGHRCQGARVNGRYVSIRHELHTGDVCEVVTDREQRPSRDWEAVARTERARAKIRKFLRDQESDALQRIGRDMLEAELRRLGWSLERAHQEERIAAYLAEHRQKDLEALLLEVATGHTPPSIVARGIVPESAPAPESAFARFVGRLRPKPRSSSPVRISRNDDIAVRFARCCQPVPGEAVVGYVTLHTGITVHRAGCAQLQQAEANRLLEVVWVEEGGASRQSVDLRVTGDNRKGLLAAITGAVEAHGLDIEHLNTDDTRGPHAVIRLRVAVRDATELARLDDALQRIQGVEVVQRVGG